MKKLGCTLLIILTGILLLFLGNILLIDGLNILNKDQAEYKLHEDDKIKENIDLKTAPLHHFIGISSVELLEVFSRPTRIDQSAYGYDWWVYDIQNDLYIQFGIYEERVVTVLGTGNKLNSTPFYIGSSYSTISQFVSFDDIVESESDRFFQFELTEEELLTKPLVFYEGVWVQLYFDRFTKQLSSIRYIDEETLLKHRPYSITYRGSLPEVGSISKSEWKEIEKGMAQQIFDLTNKIRYRHNLDSLQWHDEAADVAYNHSKDMSVNNYFSHSSPTKGELKDRLLDQNVTFIVAGENIASNYVDALSVVEGWLNSEGHRVNLLSDEFTHLGVGVFEKFYTQNFLTPLQL